MSKLIKIMVVNIIDMYWKTWKTQKSIVKVSNKGDIKVIKWDGEYNPSEELVHIYKGRKRIGSHNYYNVYRLVDEAFRGPLPEGYCIHHINFDKTDDRLSNLQRVTLEEHYKLHKEHSTGIRHYYDNKPKLFRPKHQKKLLKLLQNNEFDIQLLEYIYDKYFINI